MISYAQNFEDVILWRALKGVGNGSYIDIGAHDPVADSISLAFYEKGWRGVHVEPAPLYAQMLREARSDEVVIEAVVGAGLKPITFWVFPGTGLSTGDPVIAAQHQADSRECLRIETPCIPLSQILDEQGGNRPIHWLKIDVEGMESSVIQSWAPSKVRPWIVLVESTKPGTTQSSHESWEPELLRLGYEFVYFDGLNRFYVSGEKAELKSVFGPGANIFDGFQLNASSPLNQQLRADLVWRNQEIQRLTQDLASSTALSNDRAKALVAGVSAWETAANAFETAKTALQTQSADQTDRLLRLDQDVAFREQENVLLQQDIVVQQQDNANLHQENSSLQKENVSLQLDIVLQHQENASLRQASATLQQENASLRQEQSTLQDGFGQVEVEAAARIIEIHALSSHAARQECDLASTQSALTSVQAELAAVRASTSWRISAPLRWSGQHLKNTLRSPMEIALQTVRRRRLLKSIVWSMAALAPPLRKKLIRFAEARTAPPIMPSPTVTPLSPPAPLEVPDTEPPALPAAYALPTTLTLRARQIFADLEVP